MNLPFEQAVATHGETVLRVCRAVLGPGSDADGAWSETFLAALKAWPELDENTNVEAWAGARGPPQSNRHHSPTFPARSHGLSYPTRRTSRV